MCRYTEREMGIAVCYQECVKTAYTICTYIIILTTFSGMTVI
ncbi:hypothetical protein MKMG_01852 [Methanogenium sp. MK-MG]|nr:hypothetical protein MKMG_01852 [Methanogenium sp. MK-MG]